MKYFYWVNQDFLTPDECNEIIERYTDKVSEGTVGGNTNGSVHNDIRRSKIHFIEDDKALSEKLFNHGARVNREAFGFDIYPHSASTELQFTKYEASDSGFYDWHSDLVYGDSPSNRKLTMIIQLSDPTDYEGGELKSAVNSFQVDIYKQGTCIIFPSFYLHKIEPVIKGTRHSLVTWMYGKDWS